MFLIHDHPPANTWWVSPRWQWAKDPSLWSQDKLGLVFKSFWFRSEGVRPADLQFYESEIKFNSGTPELKKKQTSLTPSTCHPVSSAVEPGRWAVHTVCECELLWSRWVNATWLFLRILLFCLFLFCFLFGHPVVSQLLWWDFPRAPVWKLKILKTSWVHKTLQIIPDFSVWF